MVDFDDPASVAQAIQYTDVNPDLTREGVIEHVEKCAELGCDAAMIAPCWIGLAKDILSGTDVSVATTVNFPMANDSTEMKVAVARLVAEDGADEFDFPPNPAYLLSGMDDKYEGEIRALTETAHENGLVAKAMLEFGFLPDEETKARAVELACSAGIDWVKQSSGWGDGGIPANEEDVALMKEHLSGSTRIKVSGKVNSLEKMKRFFDAGAELVGTSSAVEILEGRKGDINAY